MSTRMLRCHCTGVFPEEEEEHRKEECGPTFPSWNPELGPIVNHYGMQTRRLSIRMGTLHMLTPDRFTKLTELEVLECDLRICMRHDSIIYQFLNNLRVTSLARLKLEFPDGSFEDDPEIELETGVFHWLERFPALLSLQIISESITYREADPPVGVEQKSFPNLRFLRIEDDGWKAGLNFQFLKRLPGLQHLHLKANCSPAVWDDSVVEVEGRVKLKRELEEGRPFDSNVWEMVPELGTLTIQIGWDAIVVQQGEVRTAEVGKGNEIEKRETSTHWRYICQPATS